MNKRLYMTPVTIVIDVELQQMIAFSGGDQSNGVAIDPEPDTDNTTEQMARELEGFLF